MTSVVDTSVKYFLDTMPGAPVLTGQPGSLIALLDACLINGFDTKTATSLVVAGGVATLAFAGLHSALKDAVIAVAGATGSYTALNGEQKVTAVAPGLVKFATSAADGTAAGTITFKMAPVGGWSKPFSGSNVAVYKSTDPMSNGHYLRLDDTGLYNGPPNAPGHCRVQGYETMSDIDTGTGAFPTNVQVTVTPGQGAFWSKKYGSEAGTVPIPWSVFADSRIFYFAPSGYAGQDPSYRSYVQANLQGFGDMKSYRPGGDPYATALSGRRNYQDAQSYPEHGSFNNSSSGYGRLYTPRAYNGLGTAQEGYSFVPAGSGTISGQMLNAAGQFPSPIDGSLVYTPRYWRRWQQITLADYALRAEIPGLYCILQSEAYPSLVRGSRVTGSGATAGRSLYCQMDGAETSNPESSPGSVGITLIDITGPWR